MPCKKSELVSAINSYAAARVSADANLINVSGGWIQKLVDTLEYTPEDPTAEEATEEAAEAAE